MKRQALLMAALATAAACSPYKWQTTIEPTGPGTYRFVAGASTIEHPADDPASEAQRVQILKDRMAENGLCPNGYQVTDRTPVLLGKGLIADAWQITYFIRCNA